MTQPEVETRPEIERLATELSSVSRRIVSLTNYYGLIKRWLYDCENGNPKPPPDISIVQMLKVGDCELPINSSATIPAEAMTACMTNAVEVMSVELVELWSAAHDITGRAAAICAAAKAAEAGAETTDEPAAPANATEEPAKGTPQAPVAPIAPS